MSTTVRARREPPSRPRGRPLDLDGPAHRRATARALEALTSPAVIGWVVSRVAILAALAFSRYLVNQLGAADPAGRPSSGLVGWDAWWYVRIVESGYDHLPWEAMRFFPLLPGLASLLRPLLGSQAAVLVVSNSAALASGVLLVRLARHERGDDDLAARAGWLLALLPPAFVLAMGYAESLFLLTSIWAFYELRRRRYGWAAVAGVFCGLSRPLGIVLALPATVEALRGWRSATGRDRLARIASAGAPVAGMGIYLAYAGVAHGDATRPLTVQQAFDRRGSFELPFTRLWEAGRQLLEGSDLGSGLHLPWALGFLFLLAVCFRRWPVSYGLFAGGLLVLALSASNLDSLERYGLSAFPLVLAAADLARQRWAPAVVLPLCGAGMVVYATLAFLGAYVP